jgi:hypothetical protein
VLFDRHREHEPGGGVGILQRDRKARRGALVTLQQGRPIWRLIASRFSRFFDLAMRPCSFASACAMRALNRSCIAFSFSTRSLERHRMKVSASPSGAAHSFTSMPSRIWRQCVFSASAGAHCRSSDFGVPRM